MKFHQLAQKILEVYPALVLESVFSRGFRENFRKAIIVIVLSLFGLTLLNVFPEYKYNIRGAAFVLFSLWIAFYLLEAMFNSYYFSKR